MAAWQEILSDIMARIPPSDDPRCFSFLLGHLVHVHETFYKSLWDDMLRGRKKYAAGFREYLRIRFPEGRASLARGLSDIVLSSDILQRVEKGDWLACRGVLDGLDTLSAIPEGRKCVTSWSENTVYAVTDFTIRPRTRYGRLLDKPFPIGGWRRVPLGAVCLFGEIPTDRLTSFGGDSESGWFMEAEVYAEVPTTAYIQAVFGITDMGGPKVGRATSRAERRYFGLSEQIVAAIKPPWEFERAILLYLHPDTDMSLFGDRLIKAKRLEPRTDWRRLV